jgi:hypothetical protein
VITRQLSTSPRLFKRTSGRSKAVGQRDGRRSLAHQLAHDNKKTSLSRLARKFAHVLSGALAPPVKRARARRRLTLLRVVRSGRLGDAIEAPPFRAKRERPIAALRVGAGCAAIVPVDTPHSARVLGACRAIVVDYPTRKEVRGVRSDW